MLVFLCVGLPCAKLGSHTKTILQGKVFMVNIIKQEVVIEESLKKKLLLKIRLKIFKRRF